MNNKSLLVVCLVVVVTLVLFKRNSIVAEKLQASQPLEIVKPNSRKNTDPVVVKSLPPIEKRKPVELEEVLPKRNFSVFKVGDERRELLKEFSEKTFLEIPDFTDFELADFSEDDMAIMSGQNDFGDKLTIVGTRAVIPHKNLVETLSKDKSFFKFLEPDFNVGLMSPIINLEKRNGFSEVQIWKSAQNGKDYYMFYAPREDGKGSYGILLSGERDKLEANEDYYEDQFSKIRARKAQ